MTLRRHWAAWVLEERGEQNSLPPDFLQTRTGLPHFSVIVRDKAALLWDNEAATFTVFTHDEEVNAAAISPDESRLAAACSDDRIAVWDVRGVRVMATLPVPQKSSADWLEFSADGSTVVAVLHAYGRSGRLLFLRKQHPEQWWGVLYLPELWMTVVLAGLLVNIARRRWLITPISPSAPARMPQ